jgi:transcriptional regulator with XRE-family HTH domain
MSVLLCQVAQIRAIVHDVTTTPLAAVLGANCRRIRKAAGLKQDELARAARQVGLKWTASKVRDFEAGRSAPTFATVIALTAALNSVITRTRLTAQPTQEGSEIAVQLDPVRLADLVSFDGDVTVTEDFAPAGDQLADLCSGGTWEQSSYALGRGYALGRAWDSAADRFAESGIDWTESVIDWHKVLGLAEERVAAGLGIGTEELCAQSLRLWNTTFTAQRDRLAGPDANAQRKGQVTRRLKAELEKALADGND